MTTSIDDENLARSARVRSANPFGAAALRPTTANRSSWPAARVPARAPVDPYAPGPSSAPALPAPIRSFAPVPTSSLSYNPVISIGIADAASSRWPRHTSEGGDQPGVMYRIDDGPANQRVSETEQLSRRKVLDHWFKKVGSYIGNRIDPNVPNDAAPGSEGTPRLVNVSSCLTSPNATFYRIEWREYKLASFPEGYALFRKPRSLEVRSKGRSDVYLYGSKHVHAFRSPEEFYEHAYWLYTGMNGSCECQYCDVNYEKRGAKKKVRLITWCRLDLMKDYTHEVLYPVDHFPYAIKTELHRSNFHDLVPCIPSYSNVQHQCHWMALFLP